VRLADLVTEAQRKAGRVDSNFDNRTKRWINEAQERFVISDPHTALRHEETFVADGTIDLFLPSYVKKVLWIADATNKKPVQHHDEWDREAPGSFLDETSGAPSWWRELGYSPVNAQPAAASLVHFDPKSAENVVINITGLAQDTGASGTALERYMVQEQVTCLSGAETPTSALFVKVTSIGKDVLTSDDVVAAYSAGGDPVARVFRNAYRARYRHVKFLTVPAAGTLLRVGFLLEVPEFSDDNQVTHPGIDIDYLTWYAAAMIHKAMNQGDLAEQAFARAEERLQKREFHEKSHGDQDHRMAPDFTYHNFEE
jgi:hypothetical protein